MNNLLLLLLLIIQFVFVLVMHKRKVTPTSVLILSIGIPVIILVANASYFNYELSALTLTIICTLIFCALIAESIVSNGCRERIHKKPEQEAGCYVIAPKYLKLAIIVQIINCYIQYQYIMKIGALYNATNFLSAFAASRLYLIDYQNTGVAEVARPYWTILLGMLASCIEIICLHYVMLQKFVQKKSIDKFAVAVLAIYVLSLLMNTGRAAFVPIVVHFCYLFFSLNRSQTFNSMMKKYKLQVISFATVGVITFFILGSLRQASDDGEVGEISPFHTMTVYFGAPIVGLDLYIEEGMQGSTYIGEHTFREYYDISRILGANYKRSQFHLDDFYAGKVNSNVRTGFYYWLRDFGYWGAVLYALLLGVLFGFVIWGGKHSNYANFASVYFFSHVYAASAMIFFDDQFGSMISIIFIIKLYFISYLAKFVRLETCRR